jgi:glutathione synthase/RimK-type ligase-like ATP-grasp enzyme
MRKWQIFHFLRLLSKGDWTHFQQKLYGIDLLMTEQGPIIVGVNGFRGFRGVPGADSALVALVERIVHERKA